MPLLGLFLDYTSFMKITIIPIPLLLLTSIFACDIPFYTFNYKNLKQLEFAS